LARKLVELHRHCRLSSWGEVCVHVGGVGLVVGQVVGESLLGFERLGGVRVRGLEPLSQRLHGFFWEKRKLVSFFI